jgi:hypothetical protein
VAVAGRHTRARSVSVSVADATVRVGWCFVCSRWSRVDNNRSSHEGKRNSRKRKKDLPKTSSGIHAGFVNIVVVLMGGIRRFAHSRHVRLPSASLCLGLVHASCACAKEFDLSMIFLNVICCLGSDSPSAFGFEPFKVSLSF